ncbi:16S rRNA (guanine(527)-N(7))-methyltransferase RsmG [Cellulomonas endophytica]|uniref:16S rRNA (guanine(527)-N(7))-methyltransferase RsmG n=1 Tax=Cellulomonas endophytica TaxID=2494735 RepID=UPI001F0CA3DE|nr:16S rRNA (guanine(527)-N(7))-methyltransferase RsmG [Cellulomonas endophytica]
MEAQGGSTVGPEGATGDGARSGGDEVDPLDGDPRLPEYFGAAWPAVHAFRTMLVGEGVLRGLVGPREVGRLWERHLLNSAAVVPRLSGSARVIDLGSGAGMPGVVVAAMLPETEVVLLEPMQRRTAWLSEVVGALGLANARVERGRAEDVAGRLTADVVTARAVASLETLYGWAMPLLRVGGRLVALKGSRAEEEIAAGSVVGEAWGVDDVRVVEAGTLPGVAGTRVVEARRGRDVSPRRAPGHRRTGSRR